MSLRLAVLGPVRVTRGGTPVPLGPARQQAVLVALALRAGQVVPREQLLDGVWGERPPPTGVKVLPSYVYGLRKRLDPPGTGPEDSVIRGEAGGYRLHDGHIAFDSAELEAHFGAARAAAAPADALAHLDRALALVRGDPLAGVPGPFAEAERARLRLRIRAVRLQRLESLLDIRKFAEVVDELAGLAADPCDEQLAALRIRALHGDGRQAEALQVYEELRGRLREELGVDPGAEPRRAHLAVLRQTGPGPRPGPDPQHAPTAALAPRPVNTLPGDSGHLVGRDAELAELIAPFTPGAVTVTTVHGPAGVGKSALVVRAARELSAQYPDGCLFVDLRGHSTQRRQTPEQALQRLLRSLGASKGELPSDLQELTEAWRAATSALRLLLVLDDALDAGQVRPLLPAGAGSRVLVAGRHRLAELDAEWRVGLEPLESAQAVALLTHLIGEERAAEESAAAEQLARLCDGLPLALRIAGSRLQSRTAWSVEYLVGRMAGDGRLLGELSVGDRSVEAAFRLSYDQLGAEQQRGFRALGLAPTVEFDVRTAAAMLGSSPYEGEDLLESLVDASLVQQPGPGRYRLHDLVRVHARRLAGTAPEEAAAVRKRALRLHLAAARTASNWGAAGFPGGPYDEAATGPPGEGSRFRGWREAEAWLDSFGGELPDVVGHAVASGEYDLACRLAEAYTDYFVRQGRYHESQTALELALPHAGRSGDPRMPLALRNCLGYTAIYQRRYTEARALCTESLQQARMQGQRGEEARALTGLGAIALSVGDGRRALECLAESAVLCEARQDHWLGSVTRLVQGLTHQFRGDGDAALAGFAAARRHAEASGRPHWLGRILSSSADIHLHHGRYAEAARLLTDAVRLVDEAGDVFLAAQSLSRLGTAVHGQGDPGAAIALHQQALLQLRLLSDRTELRLARDGYT
ncbi:winged helix-turn-helix domain-containing protein [Streptomyces sp. TRM66268-LWL]|uniref:Winged helix-turn-helix domain-containing protein n=1 Tax=Streptomyces polyasparticus TaxID=2767826 RepID=A0ABR7SU46_9ACTN|nr:BTAD domain-containing putative transcriptional regulator [Streptomyces polyasparticus]MBC9719014.1 winged helix-turn-helix domain-containing protein [Streptomyces polyasparticus]